MWRRAGPWPRHRRVDSWARGDSRRCGSADLRLFGTRVVRRLANRPCCWVSTVLAQTGTGSTSDVTGNGFSTHRKNLETTVPLEASSTPTA